jgi:hypothetical protein
MPNRVEQHQQAGPDVQRQVGLNGPKNATEKIEALKEALEDLRKEE